MRKTALFYPVSLVVFIGSSIFLWGFMEETDKVAFLWTMCIVQGSALIVLTGFHQAWAAWQNDLRMMQHNIVQGLRKDIDILYDRLNKLQYTNPTDEISQTNFICEEN